MSLSRAATTTSVVFEAPIGSTIAAVALAAAISVLAGSLLGSPVAKSADRPNPPAAPPATRAEPPVRPLPPKSAGSEPVPATDDDELIEFLGSLGDEAEATGEWLDFLTQTDIDQVAKRGSRSPPRDR